MTEAQEKQALYPRPPNAVALRPKRVIFHGLLCAPCFRNPGSGLRRKMENQGPIHLDISGWQAILSIRFFM
jgi:hypothetical protein